MYSDAVRQVKEADAGGLDSTATVPTVYHNWRDWPASQISHHGRPCCEIAREWLDATDQSSLNGSDIRSGPRWLLDKFQWGPNTFPVTWCDAVRRKTLDCGALAALAHESFINRGLKSYRVQLVQRFSEVSTDQWSNSWNDADAPMLWINKDLIYHEGNAPLVSEGEIKVWDASAGWWVDPKSTDGYGSLAAIRVTAPIGTADLQWGKRSIKTNDWQLIR